MAASYAFSLAYYSEVGTTVGTVTATGSQGAADTVTYKMGEGNGAGYFAIDGATGQITRGKRSQDHQQIWDLRRCRYRKTGIVAVPVRHLRLDGELCWWIPDLARDALPGIC